MLKQLDRETEATSIYYIWF